MRAALDSVLPAPDTACARLYGEPLLKLPRDLYIPPDALEVFFETFEGPLDLLLYLIRRQNFNVLDIPMTELTRQYLEYIECIRARNLELAAEYLLMAALLIEIKSRLALPIRAPSWRAACLNMNASRALRARWTPCRNWVAIFCLSRRAINETPRRAGPRCSLRKSAPSGRMRSGAPGALSRTLFIAKRFQCAKR